MKDRNSKGQFVEGWPGGPGRPPRPVEREYLDTLQAAVTVDAWRKICERAVKDAQRGDGTARRWISEYLIGKPSTVIELPAVEQALLAAVLQALAGKGYSAATLFQSMLSELDSAPALMEESDDDDE